MASAQYFINPYNFVRYDLDPKRIREQRKCEINGHNRFKGYSGRLTCELITLSPILIGDNYLRDNTCIYFQRIGQYHSNRQNMLPGIPASSLKGVIRSVAEAISSSCFSMLSDRYEFKRNLDEAIANHNWRKNSVIFKLPSGLTFQIMRRGGRRGYNYQFSFISQNSLLPIDYMNENCVLIENDTGMCLTCRLFGSSTGDDEHSSIAGKVTINDAFIGFKDSTQNFKLHTPASFQNNYSSVMKTAYKGAHTLSTPKLYHESFYIDNRNIRGRKFYYHQYPSQAYQNLYTEEEKDYEIEKAKKERAIALEEKNKNPDRKVKIPKIPTFELLELVKPNVVFQFTVDYHNLSQVELGLLCLALQLEWDEETNSGIAHKIGMGKPIGLGSVRIKIVKIEELPAPSDRYKSLQPLKPITDSEEIQEKVNGWIEELKKDDQVSFYQDGWEDLKNILRYPHPQYPKHNDPIEYPDRKWFNPSNSSIPLPTPEEVANRVTNKMLKK